MIGLRSAGTQVSGDAITVTGPPAPFSALPETTIVRTSCALAIWRQNSATPPAPSIRTVSQTWSAPRSISPNQVVSPARGKVLASASDMRLRPPDQKTFGEGNIFRQNAGIDAARAAMGRRAGISPETGAAFDMDMNRAALTLSVSSREVLSHACIRFPVQPVVVRT
ncbi:hypothetical protein JMM63_21480 [Rhodovulum sulfidophilum]|nr:hypothetical protein [Rhodovulum sulfidophilum]